MAVKGYRSVSLPLSEGGGVAHEIFLKEHSDRAHAGRVLFFGNVDIHHAMSTEEVDQFIKGLLKRFGAIEQITLSDLENEARFAHVVFEKKGSLKLALQAPDKDYLESWSDVGKKMNLIVTPSMLQRSVPQVRRMFTVKLVDCEALREEVDAFMAGFEDQEQRENREHKAAAEEVDADGFQTVTSKKRRRDDDDAATQKAQRARKHKKGTELKNFYRFQVRDHKMKQLDMLRKKFEEDKERVAKMKESRKFKPF